MTTIFTGKFAIITNTVSGGILFVIGDVIEQKFEIKKGFQEDFNLDRLKRIGIVGLSGGPPHHVFYKYLDILLPGRTWSTIMKKIILDQVIACPFFNLQFFMGMSWLEGKSFDECWNEFLKKFPTVYLVDWCLWPPCQFINFWLIPSKYRLLYVNSITVLWNVFLSYMNYYDQH